MRARVLVSVLILPCIGVFIYAPWLNAVLYFMFLLAVAVPGSMEFDRLASRFHSVEPALPWFVIPPVVLTAGLYLIYLVNRPDPFIILGTGICAVFMLLLATVLFGRRGVRLAGISGVNLVYLGAFPCFLLATRLEEGGVVLTFFLFLAAWGNDAAAYLIGSRFGRTRGIVSWSPNKSLEGFAGAFLCTLLLAAGFKLVLGERMVLTLVQSLLAGLVVGITAPAGDLLESLFKRKAGVKDSSRMVPGMGGVLDVFDSILFSAPFFYTLRTLFL
jgi:phosphatidate cytidylyltransferase